MFRLCRCARKKAGRKEQGGKEEKSQEVSRSCGATPSGWIPIKLGKCVRLINVIERAEFHRYNRRVFGAVRCRSFLVAVGNQGVLNAITLHHNELHKSMSTTNEMSPVHAHIFNCITTGGTIKTPVSCRR